MKSMNHYAIPKSQIQREPLGTLRKAARRSIWLLHNSSQRNGEERNKNLVLSSSITTFLVSGLCKIAHQAGVLQQFSGVSRPPSWIPCITGGCMHEIYATLSTKEQSNLLMSLLVSMTNASVCTTSGQYFSALFCSCTERSGRTSTFVGSYRGAFYACSFSPSLCSIYLMKNLVIFMIPSEINVLEPLRRCVLC